jgi:hypothetical protein
MSEESSGAAAGEKHERHVIFVGDIEETWDQNEVLASDIMTKAGVTNQTGLVLEALNRKGGNAVAEFKPTDKVNLDLPERKFFRITAGGGGFS